MLRALNTNMAYDGIINPFPLLFLTSPLYISGCDVFEQCSSILKDSYPLRLSILKIRDNIDK